MQTQIQQNTSSEWARTLAKALEQWCAGLKDEKMRVRALFLERLCAVLEMVEYKNTIIQSLGYGKGVLEDKGGKQNVYAALFLLGITEADPRQLPPLLRRVPNKDEPVVVIRQWTEERMKKWLQSSKATEVRQFGRILGIKQEFSGESVLFPDATQIAQQVVERLLLYLEPGSRTKLQTGSLLQSVTDELQKVVDGTDQDLRTFKKVHGKQLMTMRKLLDAIFDDDARKLMHIIGGES